MVMAGTSARLPSACAERDGTHCPGESLDLPPVKREPEPENIQAVDGDGEYDDREDVVDVAADFLMEEDGQQGQCQKPPC